MQSSGSRNTGEHGLQNLRQEAVPSLGLGPVSPALAGGFLTPGAPGTFLLRVFDLVLVLRFFPF